MNRILQFLILLLPVTSYGQTEKMSPFVRKAWIEHAAALRAKGTGGGMAHNRRITAFVRSSSRKALDGCGILAEFPGNIYIASMPVDMLGPVASHREVSRIEAGRSCSATNDTAAVVTRQNLVWEMPQYAAGSLMGYTGRGVVVGVMDIGFDLTHPTFLTSDGTALRIKRLWDQLDRSGNGLPYLVADTVVVGRQYIGHEALMGKHHSADGEILCHGTHTAGSAAGSGWNGTMMTPFRGMAPDADLCLVANYTTDNRDIVPEEDRYLYTSATDVLGFKYIFDYAASVGKPCVASFSEGSRMDLHGEDILFGEALRALLGEGRIIVASAGNESIYNTYLYKPAGKMSAGAFLLPGREPYYTFSLPRHAVLRLTFYPPGDAPFIKDIAPEEIMACEDGCLTDTVSLGGIAFPIAAAAYPPAYARGEMAAELLLSRTDGGFVGRDIPVSLTLMGDDGEMEAYSLGGYFTANSIDPALADAGKTHNILSPGGLEGIICVGATNARDGYPNYQGIWQDYGYGRAEERALYSSVGPTVAGLVKPDICAPGTYVKSALSSVFIAGGGDLHTCTEQFLLDGSVYGWAAFTGTSMATPIVSGIIAAWLEACPTLTPEDVMDTFAHTAGPVRSDAPASVSASGDKSQAALPYGALREKTVLDGYGVIDACSGMRYVLERHATGITEIPSGGCVSSDGATGSVSFSSGGIYDLHGRRVTAPVPGKLYISNGRKLVYGCGL